MSRPIGLHLIGYLTEPARTPRIQIKYVDTKNQLADSDKGNFTRDEWNHLLNLFNISNFSSASCTETISRINARRNRRRNNCGKVKTDDEPGFEDCSKLFNGAKLECIELPRDTQGTWSKLESYRSCAETCRQRFESKWRSIEFSSAAVRCKTESQRGEICCRRNKPKLGPFSACGDTCSSRFKHRRRRLRVDKQ